MTEEPSLKRTLGTPEAVSIIVGSIIGSGIFVLPAVIAGIVGSPGLVMAVWAACGVLAVFGGLTVAELGGMFPKAGGQAVFLREAWGERVAFLYGWAFFWVIQTGIIAAVAIVFSRFLAYFLGLQGVAMAPFAVQLVAVAVIVLLTAINWVGVRYGGIVSNVFTSAKLVAILAVVAVGFFVARGAGSILAPMLPAAAPEGGYVAAFGLALVSALFAYDGFNQAAQVAGEVKDPGRVVPRATIAAVLLVMVVYLAATAAYLHVLPFDEVRGSATLAADVASAALGPVGAALIAVAVMVSTFGTVNSYVLTGPRVYYAAAEGGRLYSGFRRLHPRFATPGFGLVVQAEWACLLVLSGSYETLVNYTVVGIACFHVLMGLGLFKLRRTRPDMERPYRCWGYPVVPAVFTVVMAFIVVNGVITSPKDAGMAVLIVLSGLPFVMVAEWWQKRKERGPAAATASG
ncbi:MAG TPA: amino acid permease [Candidatus Thermoplasmatota archaeon]|nr:amino acid permease [Candidatus Thermoplasmatota archaeon]